MEKYEECMEKAKKNMQVADHMVYITYKLVKDTKLLLAVLDNVFLALTNSMAALLYYERMYKKIPPFHDTFDSKYNAFVDKCVQRHHIDKKYIDLIRDVKEIIAKHRESPIEFSKGDKFVICSETYNIKSVTIDDMKKYVSLTKEFVALMNDAITHSKANDVVSSNK